MAMIDDSMINIYTELPFGMVSQVGLRNNALDGGPNPYMEMGQFWGKI